MTNWNPELYLKFHAERTQPSMDLVARIELTAPRCIIDLGCGPGNSTQVLRARWPSAQICGLDSSPQMIEKARAEYPDADWILADAGSWIPENPYDLVYSNATLQWIPRHDALIARWFAAVAPGGALAIQVPANESSPLHLALLRVSEMPEWNARVASCREMITYHAPGYYYDLLASRAERISLWQTTYLHRMDNPLGLIEWYASTGMKPYLDRLDSEQERIRFQKAVLQNCIDSYPQQLDGRILFPFQRTFCIAYKST
jgi:trans-aconitate 2-methyltransferase